MQVDEQTVYNLALSYVTLAADARDGAPPDLEGVTSRLSALCEREKEQIVPVVERAAAVLGASGANAQFLAAVQSVRDQIGSADRERVVEDLIDFALSDHRYVHEESRLIAALARAWDVHPAAPDSDKGERMWSVLGAASGSTVNWTTVHDLAMVYLAMAHQSDKELAQEEIDVITRKLGEWLPAALPSDVLNVVSDALEVYSLGPEPERLQSALIAVRDSIPVHQRRAVLSDLVFVAGADKVVLVEEGAIIAQLAECWGIEVPDVWPPGDRRRK